MAFGDIIFISTITGGVQSLALNFATPNPDEPDGVGALGNPVYGSLEVEPGQYKDLEGNDIPYDGVRIDAVIITVAQSKNIVKTPIQGRNATFKEFVSSGDYAITIEGIIASGEENVYPTVEVNALLQICQVPEPIRFINEFLARFEIDDVVIESFEFPQRAGYRDNQAFRIRAISDTALELIDDGEIIE